MRETGIVDKVLCAQLSFHGIEKLVLPSQSVDDAKKFECAEVSMDDGALRRTNTFRLYKSPSVRNHLCDFHIDFGMVSLHSSVCRFEEGGFLLVMLSAARRDLVLIEFH